MNQKFHRGDLVRVAEDLGPSMAHFSGKGEQAIVIGSYKDQFGGSNQDDVSYTLYLEGQGEHSWYYESQLTLLEHGRQDLLEQWEQERDADDAQKRDIDWIFEHGPEVLKHGYGASVARLARDLGCHDLWGASGEGFNYYVNARATLEVAAPYLTMNDKAGWAAATKSAKTVDEVVEELAAALRKKLE